MWLESLLRLKRSYDILCKSKFYDHSNYTVPFMMHSSDVMKTWHIGSKGKTQLSLSSFIFLEKLGEIMNPWHMYFALLILYMLYRRPQATQE